MAVPFAQTAIDDRRIVAIDRPLQVRSPIAFETRDTAAPRGACCGEGP
jgi:hypothetical protein